MLVQAAVDRRKGLAPFASSCTL